MSNRYAPPSSDNQSLGMSAYQRSEASRGGPPSRPNGYNDSGGNRPRGGSVSGGRVEDVDGNRRMAKTHYDELNQWMFQGRGRGSEPPGTRTNARDKLTRLTRQQFQELSTDVYDELCRRIERGEQDGAPGQGGVPFLLSRDDFHPKRNQARQKLATLPRGRFRDLASDVFYELERRYPELTEPEVPPPPPPQQQYTSPPQRNQALPNLPQSSVNRNRSNSSVNPSSSLRAAGGVANELVIKPDKSTLVVEDDDGEFSEVGGRGMGVGGGGGGVNRNNSSTESSTLPYGRPEDKESQTGRSDYFDKMSLNGRNSEGSRFTNGPGGSGVGSGGGGGGGDDRERSEAMDKLRSEYEYKLATLTSRNQTLEREIESSTSETKRQLLESETARRGMEREIQELEDALRNLKSKLERQDGELRNVQRELEVERGGVSREIGQGREEVNRLRKQVSELERQAQQQQQQSRNLPMSSGSGGGGGAQVDRLRAEVADLLGELRSMQGRMEEVMAEREVEQDRSRELENEVGSFKKRYEAAKTELRKFQRTSTMFVATKSARPEERMPVSEDGAIADLHFTSFTTSIDALLQSSRSNDSVEIISDMRLMVNSVSKIDEDIQTFEQRRTGRGLTPEDQDRLSSLKSRTNATLSNLITASKNHATSFGLSPVSLVDAAASHLTATMIDLVKLLGLRKATAYEVEAETSFSSSTGGGEPPLPPMSNGSSASGGGGGGGG